MKKLIYLPVLGAMMQPNEYVCAIVDAAGSTPWTVSKAMGGRGQQLDTMIRRGSAPRLDTAARIADVCGFDLCAINRETGERLTIDPPAGRRAG